MIHFACPACSKTLKAPDHGAGSKVKCPNCGQRLLVPPPVRAQNKTILGQSIPNPDDFPSSPRKPAPQQSSGQAPTECPTCHTTFFVPEQMIGRMVNCPKCQTTFAALPDDNAQGNSRRQTTTFAEAPLPNEREADEKYCHECGAVIRARAEICPKCGVRQPARLDEHSDLEPHRGIAILALGILSLVVLWPLGFVAW